MKKGLIKAAVVTAAMVATLSVAAASDPGKTFECSVAEGQGAIGDVRDPWSSQWIMCYSDELLDINLDEYVVQIVIEPTADYDADNNCIYKFYNTPDDETYGQWISFGENDTNKAQWTLELPVSIFKSGISEENKGFGFNTQVGHRSAKIVSAKVVRDPKLIAAEDAAAEAVKAYNDAVAADQSADKISSLDTAAVALSNAGAAQDTQKEIEDSLANLTALQETAEAALAKVEELGGTAPDTTTYEANKAAVALLSDNVKAAVEKFEAALAKLDEANAKAIAEKDAQIAKIQAELEAAKAQADKDTAKIAELEKQVETLEAEKAALETENKALKEVIATGGNANANGGNANGGSSSKDGSSPKTGDNTMVMALALLAVLSLGGVVITKKARA